MKGAVFVAAAFVDQTKNIDFYQSLDQYRVFSYQLQWNKSFWKANALVIYDTENQFLVN